MIRINRPACPDPARLAGGEYNHPTNKEALIQASHGKCVYCESSVRHVDWGEIEHIRPKDSYPALEFVWENLGFVCARCNNAKGPRFDETTPYINPYEEEPGDFIAPSGAFIVERDSNARGLKTITDIGINRKELVEKRLEMLRRIQKSADAIAHVPEPKRSALLEELKEEALPDKEFSFVVSQLF